MVGDELSNDPDGLVAMADITLLYGCNPKKICHGLVRDICLSRLITDPVTGAYCLYRYE